MDLLTEKFKDFKARESQTLHQQSIFDAVKNIARVCRNCGESHQVRSGYDVSYFLCVVVNDCFVW